MSIKEEWWTESLHLGHIAKLPYINSCSLQIGACGAHYRSNPWNLFAVCSILSVSVWWVLTTLRYTKWTSYIPSKSAVKFEAFEWIVRSTHKSPHQIFSPDIVTGEIGGKKEVNSRKYNTFEKFIHWAGAITENNSAPLPPPLPFVCVNVCVTWREPWRPNSFQKHRNTRWNLWLGLELEMAKVVSVKQIIWWNNN